MASTVFVEAVVLTTSEEEVVVVVSIGCKFSEEGIGVAIAFDPTAVAAASKLLFMGLSTDLKGSDLIDNDGEADPSWLKSRVRLLTKLLVLFSLCEES